MERSVLIAPETVLAPGRRDATGVLVLWLLRRSVWTLLPLAVIVVVGTGTVASPDELDPQVGSVADAREALRSPSTLLLLAAPVARVTSNLLAFALAFPLARRLQQHADRDLRRGPLHPIAWCDRHRLARALREWRWTSAVRRLARQRVGRAGPAALVLDVLLIVVGIVLFPVAIVVFITRFA